MAREVPIYLFTGFMDSGKTSLICDTLFDQEFVDRGDKVLLLCCEDGEVEYDEEKLKTVRARLEMLEEEDDLTLEFLQKLDVEYQPDVVFIEYNGTWEVSKLYELDMPEEWILAQHLCTVDATTFEMYQQNMRAMIMEQIFRAEVVIFNRCTDATPKPKFRAAVKAMNRPAQIVYERTDGTIDDRPDELPFDINQELINITDADYALWFMDCMDNPKKYDGKQVHFKALCYNPNDGKLRKDVFVPGRFAMTCCAADIQFLGMKCKFDKAETIGHKSWIDITARIKNEFAKEYKGKGPVLYPVEIKPSEKPEDELVYFT